MTDDWADAYLQGNGWANFSRGLNQANPADWGLNTFQNYGIGTTTGDGWGSFGPQQGAHQGYGGGWPQMQQQQPQQQQMPMFLSQPKQQQQMGTGMPEAMYGGVMNAFWNLPQQLQGAMSQIGQTNAHNQQASLDNTAMQIPLEIERIRAESRRNLANSLIDGIKGSFGGGGGLGGFQAVGPDGKAFASATSGATAPPSNAAALKKKPARKP